MDRVTAFLSTITPVQWAKLGVVAVAGVAAYEQLSYQAKGGFGLVPGM